MNNKKILMIAPASFPITGAEAICNVKLIKILSENDYKIDVVSKKMKYQHYPETNFEELNIHINSLHYVEVENKLTLKTVWEHLCCLSKFGTVFKGSHWAYCALKTINDLCKQNKYDAVLTKNSPSELLGYYIQKKYGIKWIATWNDPYPTIKYPAPYGQGYNGKLSLLERPIIKIMEQATYQIFPSIRLRDYMLKYLTIDMDSTRVIPHVVIPAKSHEDKSEAKKDSTMPLRIIHMGNLLPPRDATNLLKAFAEFITAHPAASINLTFMGQTPIEIKQFIIDNNLGDKVFILPPVKYKDSQKVLTNYDILLIIEADCQEGVFLPTKVSEAMQLGLPIFSISPASGVLHDLYLSSAISYFGTDQLDIIKETLEHLYQDYSMNKIRPSVIEASFLPESVLKTYNEII